MLSDPLARASAEIPHVTIATGHVRRSPRAEVGDDVIRAVAPALDEGGALPVPGWSIVRGVAPAGAVLWTVEVRGIAAVTVGVVEHDAAAAGLWALLVDRQRRLGGEGTVRAARPELAPWLAVALHAEAVLLAPEDLYALADLERCLAWAWLERGREAGHAL